MASSLSTVLGQQYQTATPAFVQGSYDYALRQAKNEHKFLFIYLHASEHDDTDMFCRHVLLNETIVSYVSSTFVCWGADIQTEEGMKIVKKLNVNGFPFISLINTHSHPVCTIIGPLTAPMLHNALQQTLVTWNGAITEQKRRVQEDLTNQNIRRNQDLEYEQAMLADAKRMSEMEAVQAVINTSSTPSDVHASSSIQDADEEEEPKEETESKEEITRIRSEEERNEILASLPPEPETTEQDVVAVLFTLPNGQHVQRRFKKHHSTKTLYNFVRTHELRSTDDVSIDEFTLISFPRRTITECNETTLGMTNLGKRIKLNVQEVFQ